MPWPECTDTQLYNLTIFELQMFFAQGTTAAEIALRSRYRRDSPFGFSQALQPHRFGPALYCNVSRELREFTADIHQESVHFEVSFFLSPFFLASWEQGKGGSFRTFPYNVSCSRRWARTHKNLAFFARYCQIERSSRAVLVCLRFLRSSIAEKN